MTDQDVAPAPFATRLRRMSPFTPKGSGSITDPELKERMRTLDPTERKWGFGAGGLSVLIAALLVPSLLHNTKELLTAKPVKGTSCTSPYVYDATTKLCQQVVVHHPSDFVLEVSLYAVLGLFMLFAVWKSKRSLTIFMGFLIFLASFGSLPGIVIAGYAGWLLLRSFRLQRFGTTNGKEIREVSTTRAAQKRAAKKNPVPVATVTGKVIPTQSKRYTPKAKARKK